ncbi:MAG: DUF72 domain-containing protein [Anaerolineae bacterium]|nr:DUF72 domain-containing protein [Anaerolineae bacterium]
MLYVGCAIWTYDGWVKILFPPGLPKNERLREYARRLTAVEGNTTFYASPSLATVQRWADETPETFRFSPKIPRDISHESRLLDAEPQTQAFLAAIRALGPRLGPLMLQLPPAFGPSWLDTLREYLTRLPDDVRVAVEVRHPEWFNPKAAHGAELDAMLAEVGAARIVFDSRPVYSPNTPDTMRQRSRKPKLPVVFSATQPFVVTRFIASPVLGENEAPLNEHVAHVADWLREGRDVFFYVHCPQDEYTPGIARDVYHRVAAQVPLPTLPWDALDAGEESEGDAPAQLTLF